MLLMEKKRYHLALKYFQQKELDLKERLKPVYYALMHFMQDEHPNEFKKAGGEIKETVEEIVARIKQTAVDLSAGGGSKEEATTIDGDSDLVKQLYQQFSVANESTVKKESE